MLFQFIFGNLFLATQWAGYVHVLAAILFHNVQVTVQLVHCANPGTPFIFEAAEYAEFVQPLLVIFGLKDVVVFLITSRARLSSIFAGCHTLKAETFPAAASHGQLLTQP